MRSTRCTSCHFFAEHPGKAFLTLGSIFLVVTGGEALYADMGHFGRRPIAVAWYGLVLPGLLLNYFGQAALVLRHRTRSRACSTGWRRQWGVTPLAILATMASVIASQALISGAFSLTVQAVQLDYLPRVAIRHTSGEHQGQVYVPLVNWVLMVGSIGLVRRVPHIEQARRRLRHRGDQHDGHHDHAVRRARSATVGVVAPQGARSSRCRC